MRAALPSDEVASRSPASASVGLLGIIYLGMVDPICGYMALTPWTGGDLDGFVRALLIAWPSTIAFVIPLIIGIKRRRVWRTWYFAWLAWPLLISWTLLVPLAVLFMFGIVHPHLTPNTRVFGGVGSLGLLLGLVPAGCLIYALRQPFWRRDSVGMLAKSRSRHF